MTRRTVATFPDGSQVLVTEWDNGEIEVARRPAFHALWSPPIQNVRVEEDLPEFYRDLT